MEHPEYPYTIYHDVEGYRIIDNYQEAAEFLEKAGWSRRPTLAGLSQRMDVIERAVFGKEAAPKLLSDPHSHDPYREVGTDNHKDSKPVKKVKE